MLRTLLLLPAAAAPVRAPADGSAGTLGEGAVGPFEIAPGAVTPDRLADLAAGRVLGRPLDVGPGAPQALDGAEIGRILAAATPTATLPSRVAAEALDVPPGAAALTLLGHAAPGDGGAALWLRDDAGASSPWRFQSGDGAWWRLAASPATPEMFGARGDGATDDILALETARDYCVQNRVVLALRAGRRYGITRPFRIRPSDRDLSIRGEIGYSQGSPADVNCGIRKLPGFAGAAAVEVGQPGPDPVLGLELSGFEIDGGNFSGDGLRTWRTGRLLVERVCSHRHATGWGFVIDGGFFPTFLDCVSRNNGSSELGVGGGVLFANEERENADGRWIRGHVNFCGHVSMMFAPREGIDAQSNWTIQSCEINDSFDREPGQRLHAVVDVRGAWGVVFDHVRFMNFFSSPIRTRELVLIGDPEGADPVEDVTFRDCDFQHTNENGDQWCIRARGRLKNLRIINARQKGSAKFCTLADVTEGEVFEDCPAIPANQWNDPDRRLRNVRGGYVGPRPGSDGARFDLAPTAVGAALHLGVRRSAGEDLRFLRVGDGATMERVNFGDFSLRLAPRAIAPAGPAAGEIAYSDGSSGGFDGSSGPGLYVFKGFAAGWVFVA